MTTSSEDRDPVELLAEEFVERQRRGEHPTLREYLERYPDLAAGIRDQFPALLMMEDPGESSGGTTSSLAAAGDAAVATRLQRLGDYRILREIGRGGMGVVYEAEQESLGRRVALKVLSDSALLDPKQIRRFDREARAAARLHHTNIVPVFGVGHQDGHHYFVMQFIEGHGLDVVIDNLRRLRRVKSVAAPVADAASASDTNSKLTPAGVAQVLLTGQFASDGPCADPSLTEPCAAAAEGARAARPTPDSWSRPFDDSSSPILAGSSGLSASSDPDRLFYRSVARIGIQVAEALDYANRQGILHRDIKPSNLLLDNRRNVWVADFGLAKTAEADDLTHSGDILGTIRYMAPERFSGHCDARSDVYSLGLTLYEVVGLLPAYQAPDRHTLMERVLHEEPERLKKRAPGVPRDLETIIAKAMARDPAARYATAAALADDLRRFVEDRAIRARRVRAAERLARWCRRNKGLAAAIGLAAAGLLAVAAVALLDAKRQAEATRQITRLARNLESESIALKRERGSLRTALIESNRRLARLDLERGQAAFEKGQIAVGMLWTVESLRMSAAANDAIGRHVAVANLSAWRRHHLEPKQIFSHGRTVGAVAFTADGKTVLTGSHDTTARLWDVATGRPRGPPMAHPGGVWDAAFGAGGKTVVTACDDGQVRFWVAATSRPAGQTPPLPKQQQSLALSPDAKVLVTNSVDATARLWDASTGRPIGQPLSHLSLVSSVALSRDGKTILTGSFDKTARLWDAASGQPLGPPMEHSDRVASVAFSPDGETILTGSYDNTARQWDALTGRAVGPPLKHRDWVRSVAYSPDGNTILTGSSDNTAQLWDAATGERIGWALEHQAAVWSVAFAPDGRSILTGCQDGKARLWDGYVGQPVGRLLEHEGLTMGPAALCPDAKSLLVAGRDDKVRRWDVATGLLLGQPLELGRVIYAIASSPDGKTILTGSWDRTARLWDAATGRPVGPPMEHSDAVLSVEFSPDGRRILTASADKTAALWDAATGRPIGQRLAHSAVVVSVAFSPDGKTVLTGSGDKTARVWDAATGLPRGPRLEHLGNVNSVAFSPDGKTILTGSNDKTARLWDASTGAPIGPPLEHSGGVWSVAFGPDGKTILTSGLDDMVRLWDAATAQPIGPPMLHPSRALGMVPRGSFSRDGRFYLTHDGNTARKWAAPVPLPDDVPRLVAWVEAATGLELDQRGSIRVLDDSARLERRSRLDQLGGPPSPDQAPRLDPIIFGGDPSARGDAWNDRGLWDRADAAYADAARARPLDRSVWLSWARSSVERGHLDRAAFTLAAAVRKMPDDPALCRNLGQVLLACGDRPAWRNWNSALLDRFTGTTSAPTADLIAWACMLGPDGTADPDAPVRLAQAAIARAPDDPSTYFPSKSLYLNTLAAALYRAGRFDEAIRRLQEYLKFRAGVSTPKDWAFLAMAHHRLGRHAQSKQWLDRLRGYHQNGDRARFWYELEIRLLRREALAVILYDPIFPTDPFARSAERRISPRPSPRS
jgi:WD40 repeat protein/serine/threonine protein kinase/tetratricopeptide (TPR) repeat protein